MSKDEWDLSALFEALPFAVRTNGYAVDASDGVAFRTGKLKWAAKDRKCKILLSIGPMGYQLESLRSVTKAFIVSANG